MVDKVTPPVSPTVKVNRVPRRITNADFLKPNPRNLEESGLTEEQIARLKAKAAYGAQVAADCRENMGKLKDATALTNAEVAAFRTKAFFRRKPTKTEIGMFEALRCPVTGVPPLDVRGTPENFIIY